MLINTMQLLAEAAESVSEAVTETASDGAAVVASDTAAAAGGGVASLVGTFIPIILMVLVFYFMLIRPQRKKDKQVRDMLAALKVGDRICTIGGLYGTVAGLKDDTVTLTLGSQQNVIVIARWAVRSVENVAVENDSEPQI